MGKTNDTEHLPNSFQDADGFAAINVVAELATEHAGIRVRFDNGEVRHYYRRTCIALVRRGRASCDVAAAINSVERILSTCKQAAQ